MNRERLVASIKRHEGYRLFPYQDTRGFWTIGYGHLIHHDELRGYVPRRTLGALLDYLTDPATHDIWLEHDLARAERDAKAYLPTFSSLSERRQEVLVEMAFQLGGRTLNTFVRLRDAIERKHWVAAEAEMLNSRWHQQTPNRVKTLASRMLEG